MDPIRVIEVKESIFADNNADADRLRAQLKEQKTFLLNLMSSPGSGKTSTLRQVIGRLKDEMKIGVMEADIDSDVDAAAILETGARAIKGLSWPRWSRTAPPTAPAYARAISYCEWLEKRAIPLPR